MPLDIIEEIGLTQKYIDNLKNIDSSTKNQTYFWVAELKDDTELVQFNTDGTENKFDLVKNELSQNNIKSLIWIPKQSSFKSYRMNIYDNDELIKGTGIYRRGKITRLSNGVYVKSWSYVMGKICNEIKEYYIINNKGTGFYTVNPNKEVGS